jgi:hypothetical protein
LRKDVAHVFTGVGCQQVDLNELVLELLSKTGVSLVDPAEMLLSQELPCLRWRIRHDSSRCVCILDRRKLIVPLDAQDSELAFVTERQEVVQEEFELVCIFSLWLDCLVLLFVIVL